jgi:hypothetical protein
MLATVCLFAVAGVAPASGVVSEFGSEGEGAGQFVTPFNGLAVDQGSGDVYVVDGGNARAEKWSGEGVFEFAWGWGVADGSTTAPQTCVVRCFAGLFGGGTAQFRGFPGGAAVDNSLGFQHGDVYVVDGGNHRVQKFSPTGALVLMFGKNVNASTHANVCLAGELCQAGEEGSGPGEFQALGNVVTDVVAVDSTGRVYVGDRERVQEFSAGGTFEGEIALPGVGIVESLAVDSAKDVYVTASGLEGVHKYDGAGVEQGRPREPTVPSTATMIAMGPSDGLFVYEYQQRHVQEFDAAGVQISSFVEEGAESGGMAFGFGAGVLYVRHAEVVSVVAPPPPGPAVVDGSERVDEVLPTGAAAHAIVNPEGPEATSYRFEYGPTTAYGSSTQTVELTGAPFEDQSVSAGMTGLAPAAAYHFRVVVSSAGHTTFGPDQSFTSAPPVSIEAESVSHVTASSARLEAVLNAYGSKTEYRFEYGTSTAYGQSAPTPSGDAGSGATSVQVGVLVERLQADASYHYRVVARNALGVTMGPDHVFATQSTQPVGLADGRGWELVSPANKHGVALETIAVEGSAIQAAEGGGAFTYVARAPIGAGAAGSRSVVNTQLLSTRTSAGWETIDITTPHDAVAGVIVGKLSEYQMFSTDLGLSVVEPSGATPLAPALMGAHGERTPYRRETSGQYTPLVTASNTPAETKFAGEEILASAWAGGVEFQSMTPDGGRILLSGHAALTEGLTSGGQESLYEWSAGQLTLVSILPDGKAATEEGANATLGNEDFQTRNALSLNGTRVVFSTVQGPNERHLYIRDLVRGETIHLDVPAQGTAGGTPVFQAANADGSRVFFTDDARLTPDATAKPGAADLYVCEVQVTGGHLTCALKDLTVDAIRGESAGVLLDVIGVGEAGRFVYFIANGKLTAGAVHGGCVQNDPWLTSASTLCNLYVRDTASETTSLVAVLSNRDAANWQAGAGGGGGNLAEMTARVSDNGRFMAFMSTRSLTGYDNRDAQSGEPDAEVFLFDADHGSLSCVSCNPTGARPVGVFDPLDLPTLLVDQPQMWRGQSLAASLPGWTPTDLAHSVYQSRYLSDSGRLFFNSAEGLVSSDVNGREDVYEFEPAGVGGCGLSSGCVALMSSGSSGEETAFLDASASGNDVFFLTAAKLVPRDVDSSLDVYDAHVCVASTPCPGGLVSTPPPCSGVDSCRAAPAPQPAGFGSPASETLGGVGNVTPSARRSQHGLTRAHKLTRAQKLTQALKTCKRKPARKRTQCRASARKRYGPVHTGRRHSVKSGRRK